MVFFIARNDASKTTGLSPCAIASSSERPTLPIGGMEKTADAILL